MNTETHRRRVGTALRYPLPTRLDDPALGLRFKDLDEVLVDKPAGWNREMARELAEAVLRVASRLIGEMATERVGLRGVLAAAAGACLQELYDPDGDGARPSPYPDFLDLADAFRADRSCGWGSGPAGFRRLIELGAIPLASGAPLHVRDMRDTGALDEAWNRLERVDGYWTVLPVEVVACFIPPARVVVVEGVGEVEVPSLWQVIAQLIIWGPHEARRRVLSFLANEAERRVAPRVDRREGGALACSAVMGSAQAAAQLARRITEVHSTSPVLAAWEVGMARIVSDNIVAELDPWRADRTAPPLILVRRARWDLIHQVEKARGRTGKLPWGAFKALRDLCCLMILAETGMRISELAALTLLDFDLHHTWAGSPYIGPAVRTHPRKRRRGSRLKRARIWQAISDDAARYLQMLLIMTDAASHPDEPIWMGHWTYPPGAPRTPENRIRGQAMRPGSLSGRLSGTKSARSRPVLPRPGGGGYSAHSLRHRAAQLAVAVGLRWIAARPDHEQIISPMVLSEALLNHRPTTDTLGYHDLLARGELWALRAAVGSRADGSDQDVPGVIDYLWRDAGARRGYDIPAITLTARRLARARDDRDAHHTIRTEKTLQRRAVQDRSLPTVRPDADAQESMQMFFLRDEAREEREREVRALTDQVDAASSAAEAAAVRVERARADLDALLAAKTAVIPDSEPTTWELQEAAIAAWRDAGEPGLPPDLTAIHALEDETPDEALARANSRQALMEEETTSAPPRVRSRLNMPEMAVLLSVTDGGLRKMLNGHSRPPFPIDGDDSVLVTESEKRRFFEVDRLPSAFVARLLPEQRDLLEQMLAVPMGSTPWGGRRG